MPFFGFWHRHQAASNRTWWVEMKWSTTRDSSPLQEKYLAKRSLTLAPSSHIGSCFVNECAFSLRDWTSCKVKKSVEQTTIQTTKGSFSCDLIHKTVRTCMVSGGQHRIWRPGSRRVRDTNTNRIDENLVLSFQISLFIYPKATRPFAWLVQLYTFQGTFALKEERTATCHKLLKNFTPNEILVKQILLLSAGVTSTRSTIRRKSQPASVLLGVFCAFGWEPLRQS